MKGSEFEAWVNNTDKEHPPIEEVPMKAIHEFTTKELVEELKQRTEVAPILVMNNEPLFIRHGENNQNNFFVDRNCPLDVLVHYRLGEVLQLKAE